MLRIMLATVGLLFALAVGACDQAGDTGAPAEQQPGATPPATQ